MNLFRTNSVLACLAAAGLAAGPAAAQDFAPFSVTVVGNVASVPQSPLIERPHFEGLNEASGGRVDVRFRTFEELSLDGSELVRLVSRGAFDMVALQLGYISGDAPFVLGVDIPGMAPTLEDARAQSAAYFDVLDAYLQENYQTKLLAIWPYPVQVFFCNKPVAGLDDLVGLRIRVTSSALSTLTEQVGGVAATVPFGEVYSALQRGLIDCAAASAVGGNGQKWYEVSTHLYVLPLGWGINAHVANLDFWNGLEPGAREFLTAQVDAMNEALWQMAEERGSDGISCNTGGACTYGTSGAMTLVEATEEDTARVQEIVAATVLPAWADDCEAVFPACKAEWNGTIGALVGIEVE